MDHSICSIDKIEREAHAAALKYATVDEACPYPFSTIAAGVFKQAFLANRASLSVQDQPKVRPVTGGGSA